MFSRDILISGIWVLVMWYKGAYQGDYVRAVSERVLGRFETRTHILKLAELASFICCSSQSMTVSNVHEGANVTCREEQYTTLRCHGGVLA